MTTLVNFSSDREALTERLVKESLARLRPDLYREKRLILKNIHALKELLNHVIDYTQKDMKKSSRGKIWNEEDVKILAEGMKIKHEVRENYVSMVVFLCCKTCYSVVVVELWSLLWTWSNENV